MTVLEAVLSEFLDLSYTYARSQHISGLKVIPEPNSVQFKFTTNHPTCPLIEIFNEHRNYKGEPVFDDPVTFAFDFLDALLGNLFTSHRARIKGLNQNTSYLYRITAGDGPKKDAIAIGSFQTGSRKASWSVRDIIIFNDGDPGLKGKGELGFTYALYNENDYRVLSRFTYQSLDSGEVCNFPFGRGINFDVAYAPDDMSIYCRGEEYDHDIFPGSFRQSFEAPQTLSTENVYYETDDIVVADSHQRISLPTTVGRQRIDFSLNSGPRGIHYVTTGWADVTVSPPSKMPVIPVTSRASRQKHSSHSASLWATGQLVTVETFNHGREVFGLAPGGVLVRRIARRKGTRKFDWMAIPTGGASSMTLVGGMNCVEAYALIEGKLNRAPIPLEPLRECKLEWLELEIALKDPPQIVRWPAGSYSLLVLDNEGSIRIGSIKNHIKTVQWTDLGGTFQSQPTFLESAYGADVFAVNEHGKAEQTYWPREGGDKAWKLLGGTRLETLHAISKGQHRYLIGTTAEREVFVLQGGLADWSKEWERVGTLDDLPIQEDCLKTT